MAKFTFQKSNKFMAYFAREGVKKTLGIPLSEFKGEKPPETFDITLPEGFEFAPVTSSTGTGAARAKVSVANILKNNNATDEVKRAVKEARVAAERAAVIKAGYSPDTGKPLTDEERIKFAAEGLEVLEKTDETETSDTTGDDDDDDDGATADAGM